MTQKLMKQPVINDAQNTSMKANVASSVSLCWLASKCLTKESQKHGEFDMRREFKIKT